MATKELGSTEADHFDEGQMRQLELLLDRVPAPLAPLDISALDGFLCGVLLQPKVVDADEWLRWATDIEGRALPAAFDARPLHALILKRHAQLRRAIASRAWFDPWVFELEAEAAPSESVLPWVAGFAAAMEQFPALSMANDPALLEPMALLYMHFDADDLDEGDALQSLIETLEPPEDLAEAVQDLVRSVMLIADVSQPRPAAGTARRKR
jgi:uncharacterized protein